MNFMNAQYELYECQGKRMHLCREASGIVKGALKVPFVELGAVGVSTSGTATVSLSGAVRVSTRFFPCAWGAGAQAPSGSKILESCPSLETDENLQNLIGTEILHAWDDKDRQGWFEGRVHGRNLNAHDLARDPTANFFVKLIHLVMWRMS